MTASRLRVVVGSLIIVLSIAGGMALWLGANSSGAQPGPLVGQAVQPAPDAVRVGGPCSTFLPSEIDARQAIGILDHPARVTVVDQDGTAIHTQPLTDGVVVELAEGSEVCRFPVQLPATDAAIVGFIFEARPIVNQMAGPRPFSATDVQWRSRAELETSVAAEGVFTIPILPVDAP